jgi:hypothetical protein
MFQCVLPKVEQAERVVLRKRVSQVHNPVLSQLVNPGRVDKDSPEQDSGRVAEWAAREDAVQVNSMTLWKDFRTSG